jgi:hypothetical protein
MNPRDEKLANHQTFLTPLQGAYPIKKKGGTLEKTFSL